MKTVMSMTAVLVSSRNIRIRMIQAGSPAHINIWIVNASVGCDVGKKKIDCFIPVSAGGWCGDEIYNRLFMLYISSR